MKRIVATTILAISLLYTSAASSMTCSKAPQLVFVNGVNTSEPEAFIYAKELEKWLDPDLVLKSSDVAHNRAISQGKDVLEAAYQKFENYEKSTAEAALAIYGAVSTNGRAHRNSYWDLVSGVLTALPWEGKSDELLQKMREQHTADLKKHLLKYRSYLQNGTGLYLIGHSQGSLFVNDALYVLEQHELAVGQSLRERTGGYYVAPATDDMYRPFVKEYSKFYTDALVRQTWRPGVGLPGNVSLFNTDAEEESYIEQASKFLEHVIDEDHHGFITSYFNAKLAGVVSYPIMSPAHARSFQRIKGHLEADLRRLKAPCDVWTLPVSTTAYFQTTKPLALRDAWYCKEEAFEQGWFSYVPSSQEFCGIAFPFTVTATELELFKPMALDWNNVCSMYGDSILCTIEPIKGDTDFTIQLHRKNGQFNCAMDEFYYYNGHSGSCLDWEGLYRMLPAGF